MPYLQLVGSLLYCTRTRSDVQYAVSTLCKFMSDPSPDCYRAAEQVLAYLSNTKDFVVTYSRGCSIPDGLGEHVEAIKSNYGFVAYSDASWGNEHPMYGYTIFMANGPICTSSKSLKSAESTAEAEYAAAYQATREIIFIRNLCSDIGYPLQGDLLLAVDNKAAIDIAYNTGVTARTKHFKRVFHLIREEIAHLRLRVAHVGTKLQRADYYTKALDAETFRNCRIHHLRAPAKRKTVSFTDVTMH
jgi:hypothetical protein